MISVLFSEPYPLNKEDAIRVRCLHMTLIAKLNKVRTYVLCAIVQQRYLFTVVLADVYFLLVLVVSSLPIALRDFLLKIIVCPLRKPHFLLPV